jgi:hypothetical protein
VCSSLAESVSDDDESRSTDGGCHRAVRAARTSRGMRRSRICLGEFCGDLVLERDGGVSGGGDDAGDVGRSWSSRGGVTCGVRQFRSHRRSLYAQLASLPQHWILNVFDRRIIHRECAPASRHGHDSRVGKATFPPDDLRGVSTRVRVSRETVGFLAGCHSSRLGSIGLMPTALCVRPQLLEEGSTSPPSIAVQLSCSNYVCGRSGPTDRRHPRVACNLSSD